MPADAPDRSAAPVLRGGAARKAEQKGLGEATDTSGEEEGSELCDDEQYESGQVNDDFDRGDWDDWEDREND